MTNRAVRGLELLDANTAITLTLFRISSTTMPTHPGIAVITISVAVTALEPDGPEQTEALSLLGHWDLHTDKDNRQAALACVSCWKSGQSSVQKNASSPAETPGKCMASVTADIRSPRSKVGRVQRHGETDALGLRQVALTRCAPCTRSS